ncbi:MAG: phospholipid carrier-dependent glycosyltransferase [Bacteroidota bacterium]
MALCLMIFIMLGFNLNIIPVSIMEARNFITAREMLIDNNWLLTTMNGEPRYQKPPLPSWICAVFGLVFGIKSTVAMRIPSLIFIVITGYFTGLIAKEVSKNRKLGFDVGLILLTSFYVVAIAFEAPSDIYTHGFMVMGIYQLVLVFRRNKAIAKRTLLAGIFIGCSILSKGPVSLYVLFLPFLMAYGLSFGYRNSKKWWLILIGSISLALLIGGWWYVYVRFQDAETFKSIAEKETGNWISYNVRPFYYYWSFFVQSGMWTILAFIGLLYPYLRKRVRHRKAYKFSFYWTIISVLLLSIIPEKKSRYLMPVLIPLAINTGFYVNYLVRNFKGSAKWQKKIPVYFHFGIMALLSIGLPIVLFFLLKEELTNYMLSYVVLSLVLISIGVFLIIQLKRKNLRGAFQLNILFYVWLVALGLPLFNAFKADNYNPPTDLLDYSKSEGIPIYAVGHIAPEMIWEYGDKLEQLQFENSLELPNQESFGILTDGLNENDLRLIEQKFQIKKSKVYDLNISEANQSGYKGRLRSEFYLLERK